MGVLDAEVTRIVQGKTSNIGGVEFGSHLELDRC